MDELAETVQSSRLMWKSSTVAWLALPLLAVAGCGDNDDIPVASDNDAGTLDAAADSGDEADEIEDSGSADAGADAQLDAADGLRRVTIRFKAKVGAQDLVCGQHYTGQGNNQVTATPQDFRFYVQEVRLVHKEGGREEKVKFDVTPPFQNSDVALIDFTDAQGSCGGMGGSVVNTTITGTVPAGEYDGIVFVNGVPEELNHAGPAETAAAPLDDVTLFWGWLGGYRFISAVLLPVGAARDGGASDGGGHPADAGGHQADASSGDAGGHSADAGTADAGGHLGDAGAPDGGHQTDGGGGGHGASEAAFVHVGSTGCSGTQSAGFTCQRKARNEVRLSGFDPTRNVVVADLSEVFRNSDLSNPPQCHGVAAPCVAPYAALGIDMNTGNPAATQQVFRVE